MRLVKDECIMTSWKSKKPIINSQKDKKFPLSHHPENYAEQKHNMCYLQVLTHSQKSKPYNENLEIAPNGILISFNTSFSFLFSLPLPKHFALFALENVKKDLFSMTENKCYSN